MSTRKGMKKTTPPKKSTNKHASSMPTTITEFLVHSQVPVWSVSIVYLEGDHGFDGSPLLLLDVTSSQVQPFWVLLHPHSDGSVHLKLAATCRAKCQNPMSSRRSLVFQTTIFGGCKIVSFSDFLWLELNASEILRGRFGEKI